MQGVITVGQLSCFLTYANQYTKPFNEISSVLTEIQNAFACAKRVFDFIDEEVEIERQRRRTDFAADRWKYGIAAYFVFLPKGYTVVERSESTCKTGTKGCDCRSDRMWKNNLDQFV